MIDEKLLIENITDVEVAWYLDGNYTTYDSTTIMEIIEEQPKVGEWIPCSKKLPEIEKEVLVFTEGNSQRVWNLLDHDDEYVWEDEFGGWNEFEEVLAWMPLPEEYKE